MPSGSPSSLPPDVSALEILLMWLRDLRYPVVAEQPNAPPAASVGRGAPNSHHRNAAVVSSIPDPARRQLFVLHALSLHQLYRPWRPQAWLTSWETCCIEKGLGPVSCPLTRALLGCVQRQKRTVRREQAPSHADRGFQS